MEPMWGRAPAANRRDSRSGCSGSLPSQIRPDMIALFNLPAILDGTVTAEVTGFRH